jgi:hypothetical protein
MDRFNRIGRIDRVNCRFISLVRRDNVLSLLGLFLVFPKPPKFGDTLVESVVHRRSLALQTYSLYI